MEAVNVGQDGGGGAAWVGGEHCFGLNIGHRTALHSPRFSRWKGTVSSTKNKRKTDSNIELIVQLQLGNKKRKKKEKRNP